MVLDRTTRVDGPFSVVLTFTYDAVGNRIGVRDNKNAGIQTSTYDAANRLTSRQQTGTSIIGRADFTYANDDQLLNVTRYKSVTSPAVSERMGDTTYTYDAAGRTSQVTHRNASLTAYASMAYSYDFAGRVTAERANGGALRTFTYDVVDQQTADGSTTYTYDALGNKTNAGYVTKLGE